MGIGNGQSWRNKNVSKMVKEEQTNSKWIPNAGDCKVWLSGLKKFFQSCWFCCTNSYLCWPSSLYAFNFFSNTKCRQNLNLFSVHPISHRSSTLRWLLEIIFIFFFKFWAWETKLPCSNFSSINSPLFVSLFMFFFQYENRVNRKKNKKENAVKSMG